MSSGHLSYVKDWQKERNADDRAHSINSFPIPIAEKVEETPKGCSGPLPLFLVTVVESGRVVGGFKPFQAACICFPGLSNGHFSSEAEGVTSPLLPSDCSVPGCQLPHTCTSTHHGF